jgi:hypothetical protein
MYVVLFLDQNLNYEFIVSLHSSLPRAEAAYEALLRRFVVKPCETLPPKASWGELFDDCGESPHVYRIECDGKPGEEISLSDLATRRRSRGGPRRKPDRRFRSPLRPPVRDR